MKSWVLFVISLLLLSNIAYALPNAQVELAPITLYESNVIDFNLSVNNFLGNEIVNRIELLMPGFTILGITDFFGWTNSIEDNKITWTDGTIETNVWKALFPFTAKAALVDDDTTIEVPVVLDSPIGETITVIDIDVLNDDTAPVLSGNRPRDGSYIRQGITDYNVQIDAEDPETGISDAKFSYLECDDENATVSEITLECADGQCTSAADFSAYEEGQEMCFSFDVTNNAQGLSHIEGRVGFDNTPPNIELISPLDGEYGSSATEFVYKATDNVAETLDCALIIDSQEIDSVTVTNGETTTTTYDMSAVEEGSHSWIVRCEDGVGLAAESSPRNIIVDKTAPIITLNNPADRAMISDITIDISITDNYEVDSVDYSQPLDTSTWPEGENTLTVTAVDKAGNSATEVYTFTIDRTSPTLELVAPLDNESSDVHVTIEFDIDDNLDQTLECSIYFDSELIETEEVGVGRQTIPVIVPMGDYIWYLECADDAGNTATGESRNIHVTDLTGPDMVSDIVYVARSEDYQFSMTATDISGVADVTAAFDGTDLELTNDGDQWNGIITTDTSYDLGEYSITFDAVDALGNLNTLVDSFTLIQGYNIQLNADPSESTEGVEVELSGTVVLDDGGIIPEDTITLYLPDGPVDVEIVDDAFSYTFTPAAGTHTIRAVVTSAEGFEHEKSVTIIVNAASINEESTSSSGISSSSNSDVKSGGMSCGDGTCQAFENCKKCAEDCGKCPVEKNVEEETSSLPVQTSSAAPETPTEQEQPRTPAGVGQASSWFGDIVSNPWAWIIFILITGILAVLSFGKDKNQRPSSANWDDYFKRRR